MLAFRARKSTCMYVCEECVCLNFCIFCFLGGGNFWVWRRFWSTCFSGVGDELKFLWVLFKLNYFSLLNLEVGFWVDDERCIHDLERKKKEVRMSGISKCFWLLWRSNMMIWKTGISESNPKCRR